MPSLVTNAVGTLAALFSMASFVPQVLKLVEVKDASSVSLRMYIVTSIGFTLWLIYGLMLHSWPLVASNAVSLSLAATICGLKIHYSAHPKTDSR